MTSDERDFQALLNRLYAARAAPAQIDVPELTFIKVDGTGAPGGAEHAEAIKTLYTVSYSIRRIAKERLNFKYPVPPLEGLWWSRGTERSAWRWTMMIMVPDLVPPKAQQEGMEAAAKKLGRLPPNLRIETFREGLCVQMLFVGPYSDEGPAINALHRDFIVGAGFVTNGPHHEIYLSDPNRTPAAKLRTILRQPVARATE